MRYRGKRSSRKSLFLPQERGILGGEVIVTSKMKFVYKTPSGTSLCQTASFKPSSIAVGRPVRGVRV
jgi:hypothetical protein